MDKEQNTDLRKALALSIGRKSLPIALLLWFFLGGLGAHRMYLGKVGSGILMAFINIFGWFTMGIGIGFLLFFIVFIWWIIDLIVIIKSTKSHNEVYDKLNENN